MSTPSFASTGDLTEKKISFTEIGPNLYAYTAEGDPNTGIIIGDDSVMVIDTHTGDGATRDRQNSYRHRQAS